MAIITAALLAVALAGCGVGPATNQEKISKTATTYLKALAAGDTATACAQLTPRGHRAGCAPAMKQRLSRLDARALSTAADASMDIKVHGNAATAALARPHGARLVLARVGGQWRIDSGYTVPPAAITGHPAPVITGGGRLVDIGGGRRLYLKCMGSGAPTVVLEAGLGGSSDSWRDVQPQIGLATRTCAYDRAGLGNSVALPGVHDARDETGDLQRLLHAAHLPRPYVLVGHSYGGLLVRLFAHAHPDQTAGVVLVDAMGRDQTRRQLALWPTRQAPARRRQWAKPVIDGLDLKSSEALASGIRTLGATPLAVITAGQCDADLTNLPQGLVHAQERLRGRLQDELAALSTDHVHVVALRSDHFIQRLDGQPLVVIHAIDAVVNAARTHRRLPQCQHVFTGSGIRCR